MPQSRESRPTYRRHCLRLAGVGRFRGDAWAGGFVLELCDGRRVYAESYADGNDWGPDSCASVVPMAANSDLPKLPSKHASELYGWTENLPELGEYLDGW